MRRSDREIKGLSEIIDVLNRCDTVRLGIFGEKYPYIVPLSFGFEVENEQVIIYIHGAQAGQKHELLAQNNKVCVEADICHRFSDTGYGVTCEYESVIGFGYAEKIYESDAVKGLELLLEHCGFSGYGYDHKVIDNMTIYKITIESITGKRREV